MNCIKYFNCMKYFNCIFCYNNKITPEELEVIKYKRIHMLLTFQGNNIMNNMKINKNNKLNSF